MDQSRTTGARRRHQAIRALLLGEWDPIGINDVPEARDEYDAYVRGVHKLLAAGKGATDVFDYLWWVETEHMALRGDRQATLAVSEKLAQLK